MTLKAPWPRNLEWGWNCDSGSGVKVLREGHKNFFWNSRNTRTAIVLDADNMVLNYEIERYILNVFKYILPCKEYQEGKKSSFFKTRKLFYTLLWVFAVVSMCLTERGWLSHSYKLTTFTSKAEWFGGRVGGGLIATLFPTPIQFKISFPRDEPICTI